MQQRVQADALFHNRQTMHCIDKPRRVCHRLNLSPLLGHLPPEHHLPSWGSIMKNIRAACGGSTGILCAAPANLLNANGADLGYVDIYSTNGKLIEQLVAGGALNAPWRLAPAPADFVPLTTP
jgi:hypothetical protein